MRSMYCIFYFLFVEEQRSFGEWCIDLTTVGSRWEPWAADARVVAEGHADFKPDESIVYWCQDDQDRFIRSVWASLYVKFDWVEVELFEVTVVFWSKDFHSSVALLVRTWSVSPVKLAFIMPVDSSLVTPQGVLPLSRERIPTGILLEELLYWKRSF